MQFFWDKFYHSGQKSYLENEWSGISDQDHEKSDLRSDQDHDREYDWKLEKWSADHDLIGKWTPMQCSAYKINYQLTHGIRLVW